MSTDTKYNGWTNYATWRVNLEIFDGFNPSDYYSDLNTDDTYSLSKCLQDYAEQVLFECATVEGLAADYARAFLAEVNWYEIAEHMVADFKSEAA
jgi:hypothetical protein